MKMVTKRDFQIPQSISTSSCTQTKEVKQTTEGHAQCIYFLTGKLLLDQVTVEVKKMNK